MAQAPNQPRKLEEIEQRIAVLKQFDKSMENTGKSLEDTRNDIVRSIESLHQWAQSESTILRSKDLSLCGEEHGPCVDQDPRLALEYIAASLGIEPLDPSSASLSKSAHSGKSLLQDERPTLDDKLTKLEAASRCVQEAHKKWCSAEEADGDGKASASDPVKAATTYWMQLVTMLGSDSEKKNPDVSVNFSEPSFSEDSCDEGSLSAYKDALDKHIEAQRQSLQQHQELRGRLKDDVHFLDQVIAHLAAENQRLIGETERKRMQGKKSATRKLKLLSSELQWLGKGMQNDSAAARACLHTANMSAAAEDTPAMSSGMMAVQESCRNAILQEYCSYLDNMAKDEEKSGVKRNRLERRTARADALLTNAEKAFHEKDPITGSLQVLETIKSLRMYEKALPLVEGKVDGRTFAEWLPDILQLIGETQ